MASTSLSGTTSLFGAMHRERWVIAAITFLVMQALFCLTIAIRYDFSEPPPFAKYGKYFLLGIMMVGVAKMVRHLRDKPEHPIAHLRVQNWTKYRAFVGAVILLWLQWVLLTWAKAMLPLPAGMWADIPLADFERGLLGRDAWTFLPSSGVVMTAIYHLWAPTIIFTYCWRVYKADERRDASLLAIFFTVGALGTIGQYALPSGGPIFFERLGYGDRFEAIEWAGPVVRASNHLWSAFEGNYISFATGISAMPSIHVATSVWFAFAIGRWWAWTYPVVIFLGSIMTGWHYAIDGIAATIGAILMFQLAKLMVSGGRKAADHSQG